MSNDVEEVAQKSPKKKVELAKTESSDDLEVIPDSIPKKVGPVAYRMKPALLDTFRAKEIRQIIQQTLRKTLQGKRYNQEDGGKWTRELADNISLLVKNLNMERYKHVVTVSLGQQQGSGCRYIAKCSWDAECDNYASDVFTNTTMFCVCTVFGIYLY